MPTYLTIIRGEVSAESKSLEFLQEDLTFSAIASTNQPLQGPGSKKSRINLPAFCSKEGSRDELLIPKSLIPESVLDQIEKGGSMKLFMRNRREILQSFLLMMEYDPNCITLVNTR